MEAIQILRKRWNEEARFRPFHSSLNITGDGLLLGAGTCLAAMMKDRFGVLNLDLDGREEHILALLSLAYQKPVSGAVLKCIKRASMQWAKGEQALAHLELAYAGLPKFQSADEAYQLFCAAHLIEDGVSPHWLMRSVGLDTSELDLLKYAYDPGQLRVPAGNGNESGRWTRRVDLAVALLPTLSSIAKSFPMRIQIRYDQGSNMRKVGGSFPGGDFLLSGAEAAVAARGAAADLQWARKVDQLYLGK